MQTSSISKRYNRWEKYDVNSAIERVEIKDRKEERSAEKAKGEEEVTERRKRDAEILTAHENVKALVTKRGCLLRDRRRRRRAKSSVDATATTEIESKTMSERQEKVISRGEERKRCEEVGENAASVARRRSADLVRAIKERDAAQVCVRNCNYDHALKHFSASLNAADAAGAERSEVGHRHVPLDWDVDTLVPKQYRIATKRSTTTWDEEFCCHHGTCTHPHHHHHHRRRRSAVRDKNLSEKDRRVLNALASEVMSGTAYCLLKLGQFVRAIEYLTPVLEKDKDDLCSLLWRGEAFARLGAPIIARHHLDRAKALEDACDWKEDISSLSDEVDRLFCASSGDVVDEEEEDEDDTNVKQVTFESYLLKRTSDDRTGEDEADTTTLSIAQDLKMAAHVLEREAFYKSAQDLFEAHLRHAERLMKRSDASTSATSLRRCVDAHLSIARCCRLRHAECTFSSKARRVALRHCDAAASLISHMDDSHDHCHRHDHRGHDHGHDDDHRNCCSHHSSTSTDHEGDRWTTVAMLRAQLLTEGGEYTQAKDTLKIAIERCGTRPTERTKSLIASLKKMSDRIDYVASLHGK